ncbi:MAG: hypothetical protein RR636_13270 [Clostridium sp.]|uniref:hypothetical protein n=1 Tax=Clostridium sp. TaxID=1506 RepID=UPI0030281691
MSNISLTNCNIKNGFSITTDSSLTLSSNNSIFNLKYTTNDQIIQQKLIELKGEYLNPIKITSSAIIKIDDNCSCEKITIDSIEKPSIYFIGDISRVKTLEILCSCNITCPYSISSFNGYQFSPTIDINLNNTSNDSAENLVSLNGNLSISSLNVNSYTNLRLDGNFYKLTIKSQLRNIDLRLCGDAKISNIDINSNTLITAQEYVFNRLKITPGSGHDRLILYKTSYILNFINGKATLAIQISEIGPYSIMSDLYLDNKDISIDINHIYVNPS